MICSLTTGLTRPGRRQASGKRVMPHGYHRLLDGGGDHRFLTGRADYQHSRRVVPAMGSALSANDKLSGGEAVRSK